MTFFEELPSISIIEINKDTDGRYLKMRVDFKDDSMLIRWGLDQFTFGSLKKAVYTRYFDDIPGLNYKYRLSKDYCTRVNRDSSEAEYFGAVECILGEKRKNIEFPCSLQFASNLQWLRTQVKSIQDLKHLDWNNWNGS
jgi:hypothetical protein